MMMAMMPGLGVHTAGTRMSRAVKMTIPTQTLRVAMVSRMSSVVAASKPLLM